MRPNFLSQIFFPGDVRRSQRPTEPTRADNFPQSSIFAAETRTSNSVLCNFLMILTFIETWLSLLVIGLILVSLV